MWSTELVFEREAAAEHDRAFAHVTRYFMPFVLCAASVAPVCASLTSLLARGFRPRRRSPRSAQPVTLRPPMSRLPWPRRRASGTMAMVARLSGSPPETAQRLVRVEADQHRLADRQRHDIDGETTRRDLRSRWPAGACADFQSTATSAKGRFEPFPTLSANDCYLRKADICYA